MLDLKRLRVLREVAEQGSFSAAADELHVSQSAVSQQIAALEAEVGVPLLVRLRGGPQLTDAGTLLVSHADAAICRLEEAERELSELAGLGSGELRMTSFSSANATLVTRAARRFHELHPGVRLSLTEADPEDSLPALKRGDPDFFPLVVGNYTLGGGGFVSRLMKEVRDKRGLAYSVSSYFMPLAYLGPFQLGMQTKKAQAKEALTVSRQVLAEFLANGPTDTELQAAKQNLIGSFPLRLDSNRKLLDNVALIGFYRLPLDYLDTYQANIEKVTLDEIKAAFSRRLPTAHLVTVVVAGE